MIKTDYAETPSQEKTYLKLLKTVTGTSWSRDLTVKYFETCLKHGCYWMFHEDDVMLYSRLTFMAKVYRFRLDDPKVFEKMGRAWEESLRRQNSENNEEKEHEV